MRSSRDVNIIVPHSRLSVLALIRDTATVLSEKYEEDGAHLHIKIPAAAFPLIGEFAVK